MTYTWLLCKHSVPGPHLLLLVSSPSPTFLFLCPRMQAGKGQGGSVGRVCWVLPRWGSCFPPPALPTPPAQLPRGQQGMLVVVTLWRRSLLSSPPHILAERSAAKGSILHPSSSPPAFRSASGQAESRHCWPSSPRARECVSWMV